MALKKKSSGKCSGNACVSKKRRASASSRTASHADLLDVIRKQAVMIEDLQKKVVKAHKSCKR